MNVGEVGNVMQCWAWKPISQSPHLRIKPTNKKSKVKGTTKGTGGKK